MASTNACSVGSSWCRQPAYRTSLVEEWIPSLEGVQEQLEAGGHVADVALAFGGH